MSKKDHKLRNQTDPELTVLEQDENFYFIAGFTSGGVPYGNTWEEAAEQGISSEKNYGSDEHESPNSLPF